MTRSATRRLIRLAAPAAIAAIAWTACATVRAGGAAFDRLDRASLARCRLDPAHPVDPSRVDELIGTYTLVLADEAGSPRQAVGRLELRRPADDVRGAEAVPGLAGPAPILVGRTDVDASLVEAVVPGSAGSEEPTAPGVGLYAFAVEPGLRDTIVVLRLGSEANRRDRQRFDGVHTTLRITSLGDDRFGGDWSSDEAARHAGGGFCAIRD